MKFFYISILFLNLLEGGIIKEWVAYKETLFVGEPVILILKIKNMEDKQVKIPAFRAKYPYNKFDLIFKRDTFRYYPGFNIKFLRRSTDSITIMPGDSVYSYTLLFWKDFGVKEHKYLPFPEASERCKIWINKADTVHFFFIEPPKEEFSVFEAMKNFHEAMRDKDEYRTKLLSNFLLKKSHLSPYLYHIQYRWSDLPTKIKIVRRMKGLFPTHILTEWAEVHLMSLLNADKDLKNKNIGQEMLEELAKKYPSNIVIRKALRKRR